MPSSQRPAPAAATAAKGGAKRSEAAIQRRKQKARARSKVKKLRAEGATVPRALALAVQPAKRAAPRHDKINGFALKLLAAGEAPTERSNAAGAAAAAISGSAASTSSAGSAPAHTPSEWCRRGALVRFTNRRIGEVLADPDADSEVKLKWLDDGQESRFVHVSQLEYVAADVEEYADDGEGPVRKPHKKAARKAAREAAAMVELADVAAPLHSPSAGEVQVEAACTQGTVVPVGSTVAAAYTATAPVGAVALAASQVEDDAVEAQQRSANHRPKSKKEKRRKEKKRNKEKG
jgi:hypothetical protein